MYSNPYGGISADVAGVLQELISPEDEYHTVHTRRMARTLEVFKDQNPKGKVLELGGSGVFTVAMQRLMPHLEIEVTNFDRSQPVVHEFVPRLTPENFTFTAYNINLEEEQIPVERETYDWVICCEVVEHMDVDPMFMLSEVNRVTKRRGHLLLTTPNITSSRSIDKILHGVEPYFFMQYHRDRSPYRHNYEYSVISISKVLTAAGYVSEIWTEDTFEDPFFRSIEKLKTIGITIPHIGDNIFAISTKEGPVRERYPGVIYV